MRVAGVVGLALLFGGCALESPGSPLPAGNGGSSPQGPPPGPIVPSEPACGPVPVQGGSRLKPRVLVDDEGVEIPIDVFDTVSDTSCVPLRLVDGTLRCAPPGSGNEWTCHGQDTTGELLQVELEDIGDGLAARMMVGDDGSRLNFGSFHDLELGTGLQIVDLAAVTGQPQLLPPAADYAQWYSSNRDTVCVDPLRDLVAVDGCTITDGTAYLWRWPSTFSLVSTDVDGHWCKTFGEGAQTVIQTNERLLKATEVPLTRWRYLPRVRGGDGRFQYDAYQVGCYVVPIYGSATFDTALGDEPCAPQVAADDVTRCLPYSATVAYADPDCTQRIAVGPEGGSTQFAAEGRPSSQFPDAIEPIEVWRLASDPSPAESFYWNQASVGCVTFSQPGWVSYELGEAVPPETFGAVNVELR